MANNHVKRCSKSLIRDMQIKTTMRCLFTLISMIIIKKWTVASFGEHVEKLESSHFAGGKVKNGSLFGKTFGRFLQS